MEDEKIKGRWRWAAVPVSRGWGDPSEPGWERQLEQHGGFTQTLKINLQHVDGVLASLKSKIKDSHWHLAFISISFPFSSLLRKGVRVKKRFLRYQPAFAVDFCFGEYFATSSIYIPISAARGRNRRRNIKTTIFQLPLRIHCHCPTTSKFLSH